MLLSGCEELSYVNTRDKFFILYSILSSRLIDVTIAGMTQKESSFDSINWLSFFMVCLEPLFWMMCGESLECTGIIREILGMKTLLHSKFIMFYELSKHSCAYYESGPKY